MNNTFAKIAVFQYSSEAQILRGRLEAEGIKTFLNDQYTIDTDPLVSHAIGGVKLLVYSDDKEKALRLLKSIDEFSIDDEGNKIHCPNCNSSNINYFTHVGDLKSFFALVLGFFTTVLPFYANSSYRCENCKQRFNKVNKE
ncbi:DUF2007 domain-containing protein [Autumnicola musiva]|uniref:DUF2007 domain-containing protein n=1 Tax=Autumnicola musiva TaxID=3075589 RepID=A0ABU3D8B1_9FLAO|nr:DUF2007 domain-containing protein [Zunongwangia sp. F117]MDT0677762.1 DUF2007 domain-containing protein [Zunongwangia sp. F117]